MKKIILFIIVIIILGLGYYNRVVIKEYLRPKPDIPQAVSYQDIKKNQGDVPGTTNEPEVKTVENSEPEPVNSSLESEASKDNSTSSTAVNLAIPFQPQAPFADWSLPYKEACEEASVILVDHYYSGKILDAQHMSDEIVALTNWEAGEFGSYLDTTIAQTAVMAEHLGYQTLILENITVDKIVKQLQLGRPVILPLRGREMGNPYYTFPGPLYHMLVIKGYQDGLFITNDIGTKRGADYVYSTDVIMSAIGDWDGDSPDGPMRGLVIYP